MSLDLKPDDIDTIETGGTLDGQEVKLLRSRGGFWLGVVKGKVVAGGSHPAIVKHSISKMYPAFQAALCKSENFGVDAIVDKHSHFLTDDLRKSGHDVYSIQTGNEVEFQITKNNIKVASAQSILEDDSLFVQEIDFPQEFVRAMAAAATEKAIECKSKAIKVK